MAKRTSIISNQKNTSHQDWHRADIIAAVRKRGSSVQRISQKLGYANCTLYLALYSPWPKAERIIAEFIGLPPHEIWPSRYREDGSPKSKRGERDLGRYKKKHSTGAEPVNGDMVKEI